MPQSIDEMKKAFFGALFLTTITLSLLSCTSKSAFRTIDGFTQGTTYHIVYEYSEKDSLNSVVDELLRAIDSSMSVYNPTSIVSAVNKADSILADSLFIEVFNRSVEITKLSKGAFDISGGPLFDAWGFGSKDKIECTKEVIDSLMQFIGMDKVKIENGKVIKANPGIQLNFNAIAQGYTSDVIAREFDKRGINNYLVEIGGEIFCKGKNSKGELWSIGIDRPEEGNFVAGEYLEGVVLLSGRGLATSGNYRKFTEENGEKYSHTIDPRTGYPVKNKLLSATVIAPDAMTADGLATYFMVVGLDEAKEFLAAHKEIDAYLIYSDSGMFKEYSTPGVQLKK